MKNLTILFAIFLLVTTGCDEYEEGHIKVQNKVHNVTLQNINWGGTGVYDYLMTGETSYDVTISDKKDSWPKTFQLEFYMVADGNRVYLKTRQQYTLDYDQELLIVVADTTAVYNPSLE